jgi:phosphonate transport system substrate-binding protein
MDYLSGEVPDATFDLDTSNDYADFERKLSTGVPHFALPNPYHAVKARDWGYHVIAKMGDDERFRGIFIVRKDSPVKRVEDLRGKVVSYPAPTALAAAMMPQLYLQNHGIDVETEITNTYVGTHNSSIMNAYLGQSAAGATWPVAWQAFEKANPKEASDLYVIWQTPKLIQNAIVVRNDVKPEVRIRVQQLLATLHQSDAGRALLANIDTENFEVANDAQFDVVVAFLKEYQTKVKKQR